MRIRKKEPSVGVLGKIVNSFTSSKNDTYSADFINNVKSEILSSLCPIGKIEVFFDNYDHSNHLGFKWERTCVGKAPVGVNASDSEFSYVGKAGGSKSNNYNFSHAHGTKGHVLTIAEMPSHTHENVLRAHQANVTQEAVEHYGIDLEGDEHWANRSWINYNGYTGGGQAHSHGNTEYSLGATSISTVQPYEVVAFWKRVG